MKIAAPETRLMISGAVGFYHIYSIKYQGVCVSVVGIHLDGDFGDIVPNNHGKAVYIINFEEIAYHQDEVLYIINGVNRCISSLRKHLMHANA